MKKIDELSYMAGILDSEGYIGIKKTNKREQVSPYYHERVCIGISNKKVIDLFYKRFGGSMAYRDHIQSKFNSNHPYWQWEVSDKKAAEVCRIFVDYLIIKKRQAKLVLKLRESKNKGQIRGKDHLLIPSLLHERDVYYQRIISIHGRKRSDYWSATL